MEATGLNTDQAVEAILAPEQPETDEQETAEVEEVEAAPDEGQTDEAEAGDVDEADDTGDESEESDEDEDGETLELGDETLISVMVDGEEIEVPFAELKRGYSGQRKIQEDFRKNAETRKQLDAERQQANQAVQNALAIAQQMQQAGLIPVPQAPDPAMAENDPVGYMQDKARFDAQVAQYQQQQAQIQYLQHQQAEFQQRQLAEYQKQQIEILRNEIPELMDPEKGPKLRDDVRGYLIGVGFPAQAVDGMNDALPVKLAIKAMRYDQLQAGKDKIAAKTAKARPALKAGSKQRPNPKASHTDKLKRAMKTQSVEDWASVLFSET